MVWYGWLLIGFICGGIAEYYILRSKIGNRTTIDADIKNKKGNMTDNLFKGEIGLNSSKMGFIKRMKNKRLIKKQTK